MIELNKIYNEDCLETLAKMEDNSVDLIITSPPYNKGHYSGKNRNNNSVHTWNSSKTIGGQLVYDLYEDDMPQEEYEKWQRKVLDECLRVLKPTGSIFYNHKDILYKNLIVTPKWIYDYPLHQQIIWNRSNSPMIRQTHFLPVTEYIFWIVKDPKQFFFDKSKCEYKTSIWSITAEKNPHPAPFPSKMVKNIINGCSQEGDIVYDPFMGSGTTAKCAKELGRNYIGSEISPQYIEMCENI